MNHIKNASKLIDSVSSLGWAFKNRIIEGKPYTLKGREFLREIYSHFINEKVKKEVVIMKGAQLGVSELAVNLGLYVVDNIGDVMYLLPGGGDASNFSSGRFNPAIENSERLSNLFNDVSNIGHKRTGERNLFVRGANSESGLRSTPVDFLVIDEYSLMPERSVELALDRLDASEYKWILKLSTPLLPEMNIHSAFLQSDQREFFVKCQKCGLEQPVDFFENIFLNHEKESYFYGCKKCKTELNRNIGQWKALAKSKVPGYHISQTLSPTVSADDLIDKFEKTKFSATVKENFYNSKLGLPYVCEGDKLLHEDIEAAKFEEVKSPQVCGIDVGSYLHVIFYDSFGNICKVQKYRDFAEVERIILQSGITVAVIDAMPETRKARELQESLKKNCKVFLCRYVDNSKAELNFTENDDSQFVTADRTSICDAIVGRYKTKTIKIPGTVDEEFCNQLKAPMRTIVDGVPRYVEVGADHYFHANVYAEIAYSYYKDKLRTPSLRRL